MATSGILVPLFIYFSKLPISTLVLFYVGVPPGEINPFVVFTCPHQHTPCFCLSWTLMDIRQDIAPCLLSSQLDKHSTARHCLVLCSLRSKQNVVSYWSSISYEEAKDINRWPLRKPNSGQSECGQLTQVTNRSSLQRLFASRADAWNLNLTTWVYQLK